MSFRRGAAIAGFSRPRPRGMPLEDDWIYLHRKNLVEVGSNGPSFLSHRRTSYTILTGATALQPGSSGYYALYDLKGLLGNRIGGNDTPKQWLCRFQRTDGVRDLNNVFYGMGFINESNRASGSVDYNGHLEFEQPAGANSNAANFLNNGASSFANGSFTADPAFQYGQFGFSGHGDVTAIYTFGRQADGTVSGGVGFRSFGRVAMPAHYVMTYIGSASARGSDQTIECRFSICPLWGES